jgi:hypothetical protein
MSSSGAVQLAVTAVGATQITALALSPASSFVQITTGASTTGVALPANLPAGVIYTVRNDANNAINIYPSINTSVTPIVGYGGQIDQLGVNLPFIIAAQSVVQFISAGTNSYFSMSSNGMQKFQQTVPIADRGGVAVNVLPEESGSLITIAAQTVGALTVNLPTAVGNRGLNYRFKLLATAGQVITLTPAAGTFSGSLKNNVAAGVTCIVCTASATISFTAAATVNSYVDVVCDGVQWTCDGVGTLSGAGWV